jgi:hypothetical protein
VFEWDINTQTITGQGLLPTSSSVIDIYNGGEKIAMASDAGVRIFNRETYSSSVPVIISPTGTITTGLPEYSFWAADGVDWYALYVDDTVSSPKRPFGNTGTWFAAEDICDTQTGICRWQGTVAGQNLVANQSHDFYIRTYDEDSQTDSGWQLYESFNVAGPIPAEVVPISATAVVDEAIWHHVRFVWTDMPDAEWYEIWVDDGNPDNRFNEEEVWYWHGDICDGSQCSLSLFIPGHPTRYFLRSYGPGGYSRTGDDPGGQSWSQPHLFTQVSLPASTAPQGEGPADGPLSTESVDPATATPGAAARNCPAHILCDQQPGE